MHISKLPKESGFQDNGFTIRHIPVVSSAHFTQDDIAQLRASRAFEHITNDGGIVLFVLAWEVGKHGISADADRLIEEIDKLGYSRIEVDGEIGDEYEGFATHDHDL